MHDKRISFLYKLLIFGFIGIFTGIIGFILHFLVELITNYKYNYSSLLINNYKFGISYIYFIGISIICIILSACLCIYICPEAKGSGIAEVLSFLNGVNVPHIFDFKTLIIKMIGLWLSISGGIIAGKEGPMIHAGAIIAIILGHIPKLPKLLHMKSLKRFRFDWYKKEFVTAGIAAGISAAFGSPIGGVLFAMEEISCHLN